MSLLSLLPPVLDAGVLLLLIAALLIMLIGTLLALHFRRKQMSRELREQTELLGKTLEALRLADHLLWRQANFDGLTGLPNRQMFHDRLRQVLLKARRDGTRAALMLLDLDHFKEVNDTLGHDKGDLLLKECAQRLRASLRESDTIARLGGDEFVVVLAGQFETIRVGEVAEKLLRKLAEPYRLEKEVIYLSTSIGITLYPDDALSIEDLLKNADQAMYGAKKNGRNSYQYFTPSMQKAARARMRIANDLRTALEKEQMWLAYQPIVDLRSGRIIGAEALLRWNHPDRGLIPPAAFIPVAEDTGIIHALGDWTFHTAVDQLKAWRRKRPGLIMSFNKSPMQFRQRHHAGWLDYLRKSGLPGEAMVVEITEGLMLEPGKSTREQLLAYRDAGVQVAVDDFGTGYSSLSYLRKFHIDYLKIDSSFVRSLAPGNEDMVLCEAMISMSHRLGLKVIAEGVETPLQRQLLLGLGCDYAQGFLFSPAVPAADFEAFLAKTFPFQREPALPAVSSLGQA